MVALPYFDSSMRDAIQMIVGKYNHAPGSGMCPIQDEECERKAALSWMALIFFFFLSQKWGRLHFGEQKARECEERGESIWGK